MAEYVPSLALSRKVAKALQNADRLELYKSDVRFLEKMLERYSKGYDYTRRMAAEIERISVGGAKSVSNWIITPDKFLSKSELSKLIVFLASEYEHSPSTTRFMDLFICNMLLATGLRNSELCNLRVDQTSFVEPDCKRPYVWVRGKRNKLRTVMIPNKVAELIAYYVENVRPKLLPKGVGETNYRKPLLYNRRHKPYTRKGLWFRVMTIGRRAGLLKGLYPHKFRHTLGTHTNWQTKDLQLVQAQLGHSSINTTAIYSHIDDGSTFNKVNELDIINVTTSTTLGVLDKDLQDNDLQAEKNDKK